jgi:hypothetical protein
MKHSGLQKSISSIFDGAEPLKQETPPTVQTAAAAKPQPAAAPAAPPITVSTTPLAIAMSQTQTDAPTVQVQAPVPQPARPAVRPRPVPKHNTAVQNTPSVKDLWSTMKNKLTGNSKGAMDSKQKKTLILGISLAVVFVAVLLFVLGTSPSGAKAASKKAVAEDVLPSSVSGSSENWQKPEIYPLSLRDPMKPSKGAKNDQADGEMTVRGIVYSSTSPSAIIANQIVYEGDVILGVKIIKIGKDFVAFEKDGKQWQQQVRQ